MRRRAIRAAWSLLAAFAVIVAILAALAVANGTVAFESLGDTVALLIAFAAFMVVGALIVAHRPGNAVGWVFSAVALLAVTGATGEEWARYAAVTRPGSLPGAVWPPGGPPGPGTRPWPWWWCSRRCCSRPAGCCRRAGGWSPGRRRPSRPRSPPWPPSSWPPAARSRTRSDWRGWRTPRTAGSARSCSRCSAPWSWPRSPRWWSGSGAPGRTNASSSSGSRSPVPCSR